MNITMSYMELKKKLLRLPATADDSQARLGVKESGILNYLHTTGAVKAISGGMVSMDDSVINDVIPAMLATPEVGNIVAVVNTGIYLLVEVVDDGAAAICARIEFNDEYVYTLPTFTITQSPNDLQSSFNKFPLSNMFTLRKSNFDMAEVRNRYMLFKSIWTEIKKVRKDKIISERN